MPTYTLIIMEDNVNQAEVEQAEVRALAGLSARQQPPRYRQLALPALLEGRQEFVELPREEENHREENHRDNDEVEVVFQEIFPAIDLIRARMAELGLNSLAEPEWDGSASYCPWCEVGTQVPNEVGRYARLVDSYCQVCEEVYCHLCRPVFILRDGDCVCEDCIKEDETGDFEINPADIPKIEWISSEL